MNTRNKTGGDALPGIEIDKTLSFRHPLNVEALGYWRSLLKGRAMPARADLDPRAMRGFLADMGLMETRKKADGTSDYFVRLAGTRTEQIYGPVTGKLISEFLPPEIEARWRGALDAAVAAGGPVRTIGRMAFQKRTWLEVECLVAPLGDDGQTISMLMIVVATWEAEKKPG
jgi:hypothetical protein